MRERELLELGVSAVRTNLIVVDYATDGVNCQGNVLILFSPSVILRGAVDGLKAFAVNRCLWMCTRLAAFLVGLGALTAPVSARAGWTFCVAESSGGKDIWITGVFAAKRERERLEGDFNAYLKSHGVARSIAQCPAAKADKTEMVNAQITAAEFHRKLGDALHEVMAPEFDPRR